MKILVFLLPLVLSPIVAFSNTSGDCLSQEKVSYDSETEEWARNLLKSQFTSVDKQIKSIPEHSGKCFSGFTLETPSVYLFTSWTIPEETWIQLSHDLNQIGGTLVIRGIPKNSFSEFTKRVLELKKRGFEAAIQIDPGLFLKYQIDKVPALVVADTNAFDKLSGNVSLSFALEQMAEKGETKLAKILNEKLMKSKTY